MLLEDKQHSHFLFLSVIVVKTSSGVIGFKLSKYGNEDLTVLKQRDIVLQYGPGSLRDIVSTRLQETAKGKCRALVIITLNLCRFHAMTFDLSDVFHMKDQRKPFGHTVDDIVNKINGF